MRSRVLAVMVAVALASSCLVVVVPLTSAAPGAPSHRAGGVTLSALGAKSDVGKKVRLSGVVRQGKAVVKLQRKYAGGTWTTVATTTSSKKGAYAAKVPLVQSGPTSFRAKVGPKASQVRSLAVYGWLDLVDEPVLVYSGAQGVINNRTSVIQGKSLPRSIEASEALYAVFQLSGACTKADFWTGLRDKDRPTYDPTDEPTVHVGLTLVDKNGMLASDPVNWTTPLGPAVRRTSSAAGSYITLISIMNDHTQAPTGDDFAVLGSPRVYCNLAALPDTHVEDLPLRISRGRHLTRLGSASAKATSRSVAARAGAVTLSKVPAKGTAGKKITLKGSVAGAKAGLPVRLQRKYVGESWKTIGGTTTSRTGAYSAKVLLEQGGSSSFRAKAAGRTSPQRSTTVWEWLDVAEQPYYAGNVVGNQPVVVGGKSLPRSFLSDDENSGVYLNPDGLCSKGRATTGFQDRDRAKLHGTNTQEFSTASFTSTGTPIKSTSNSTPAGQVRRQVFDMNGAFQIIQFGAEVDASSDNGVFGVLGSPQVLCKVAELPPFDYTLLASRTASPGPARLLAPRRGGPVVLGSLPATSESGKKVRLAGSVHGARQGTPVMLQRKYPGGGWQTISTVTTDRSGKFSRKVVLEQGGKTSFRASAGGRKSSVRSLTVWAWLDVTEQPYYLSSTVIIGQTAVMKGKRYPHSILMDDNEPSFFINPGDLCTKGRATTGVADSDRSRLSGSNVVHFLSSPIGQDGTPTGTPYLRSQDADLVRPQAFPVGEGPFHSIEADLSGDPSSSSVLAVIGTPQVYCKVSVLPAWDVSVLTTSTVVVRPWHF